MIKIKDNKVYNKTWKFNGGNFDPFYRNSSPDLQAVLRGMLTYNQIKKIEVSNVKVVPDKSDSILLKPIPITQ